MHDLMAERLMLHRLSSIRVDFDLGVSVVNLPKVQVDVETVFARDDIIGNPADVHFFR